MRCSNTQCGAVVAKTHQQIVVQLSFHKFATDYRAHLQIETCKEIRHPVLQCVAVCCSVLQCVALCCSMRKELRHPTLQCIAVCCSVLQCVAECCSIYQKKQASYVAVCYSVVQCNALCCSICKKIRHFKGLLSLQVP